MEVKPESVHLQPMLDSLAWLLRATALAGLLFVMPTALAGSIGFLINFTADEMALTNTGTEAGYEFSLWTLDESAKWQKAEILSGNAAYLAPAKSLKGRRHSAPAATGLGRADPLLVVFYDQAGSRIAQLAWRQAPARAPYAQATWREARQLHIARGSASEIAATHGIVVPYEGIDQLAHRFSPLAAPPDPLRHVWTEGSSRMTLDTGAGQGGVWLVHETAGGALQVQIVADGLVRGQEQVPAWLGWARRYLMTFAQGLAVLGAALLVAGLVGPLRRRTPARKNT